METRGSWFSTCCHRNETLVLDYAVAAFWFCHGLKRHTGHFLPLSSSVKWELCFAQDVCENECGPAHGRHHSCCEFLPSGGFQSPALRCLF